MEDHNSMRLHFEPLTRLSP